MTRMHTGRAALALALTAGGAAAQDFDLDALIEAARAEPPLVVYAVTGKIVETAEAFSELYGVEAEGRKVNEADQIELTIREAQSGNVVGDLAVAGDVAALLGQVVPQGLAASWLPPDMAEGIAPGEQDPLVVVSDPHVWAYSTEVWDECPVSNVWELTEPEWQGRLAMMDPLVKALYADWFNQLETHHDDAMAAAYEAHFGHPLETEEASATAAWVRAFAENAPLLGDSTAVAQAIGAVGQEAPFFGILSTAKFRDNLTGELSLGICEGMEPFSGWLYPGLAMIAEGTDSPNAARLFTRYLLTEEGIAPMSVDGKMSSNSAVPANPEEVSGVAEVMDQLMTYDTATAAEDFDRRQDWQDFWRIHYAR
ncbi:ABC transporter substrate-binding protein [Wenxinia marina]|uniref:ABC-type Fe3+ transport system, periplasmic component n=1 Tax=Wenxinia marina DSM 24838 TaxID=1123501 RepID=A0A0D0QGW4_9RHOB|nr:ABC transporter substrate-binding protein [Wenxinia marina]KIQ70238.1 ABC-type Fe3+ transport system, periplasmic component [Wenxinia marina DSM 24838]GGL50121.1 ABC transporter substrate-binding protein [Wenxinia marina]